MPQIDIKLRSSADLSGVQQMQAELNKFGAEVQRKFNPVNFGKSLLSGLGFGSGFAAIQSTVGEFFRSVEEQAKQAQAEMDKFAASVNRVGAAFDAIASKRITNSIELLAPAERIEAQKKEIQKLERATAEWRKERDEAARKVAEASTVEGKLMTMWRGSPESGDYSNFLKQFINQEEVDRAVEKWSKDQADIQQRANEGIADAETKIDAANDSIRRANKEIEDQKAKDAETTAKKAKEVSDAQLAAAKERAKIEGSIAAINAKITADFQRDANNSANADDAAARKREQEAAAAATIRAAQDAVTSYDIALQKLAANPYLTDQEKQAQRLSLLQQQTQAINDQKKALDDFVAAHPGFDVGGVTSARGQLGDKETAVAVDIYATKNPDTLANRDQKALRDMSDPAQHYQTAGEGIFGGMVGFITEVGTMADQLASGIRDTLGAAVSGITNGIMGWVNGTMTFKQALANIGQSILQTMLQTIVQMGVQWLVNAALIKLGMVGIETTGDALRTARVAKENAAEAATLPAKTAGAAAAGISSWGVALAFGALAVALIMSLAGGFSDGGFTMPGEKNAPAGVVHRGEWVAPKWMVEDPVYGPAVAALEAARQGTPGFFSGGFAGVGQFDYEPMLSPVAAITRPAYQPDLGGNGMGGGAGGDDSAASAPVINQAFFNSQQDAETWLRSQAGRRVMIDFIRQNAAELS